MRYIAGNVSTVTSQLDRIVALILKMCKSHFVNFCRKSEEFTGRKYVFDVETSMYVIYSLSTQLKTVHSVTSK